ncbi:MAG TPA: ribose-5-phosphate isomerase RpiA, partial [Thermoleophilaceae bacterium]|nr:ribose-5-phosphate isomerase RpiA [Thermoleophilaceae bacterium]
AAAELVEPGMTIGLGSGRAVWRTIGLLGERDLRLRAAVASERTGVVAEQAGIEVVELDGKVRLDVALDGADQLDAQLRLIKGGGGALLREKIVISAARRFVVMAEQAKRVERLGQGFRLPVEVAGFGWRDTCRRLAEVVEDPQLREDDEGRPYRTDEGHLILDCALVDGAEPEALEAELSRVPGVLEHGLFIGMAARALLGRPDGGVEVLDAAAD